MHSILYFGWCVDIFDKLSAVKEYSGLLTIPFLSIAYCDYFPASRTDAKDVAWLYSISPILGSVVNMIIAIAVAIIFFAILFSGARRLSEYYSVSVFSVLGIFALAMALAPPFGIQDFAWIKPSLSFALGTIGFSMLSLGCSIRETS